MLLRPFYNSPTSKEIVAFGYCGHFLMIDFLLTCLEFG